MYQRWSQRIANEAWILGEEQGIEKGKTEGKIEGKIETLMTILQTFNVQYTHQEEALLRLISEPSRLDEILISVTKSQGQSFHDVMQQLRQIPSS
jgi:hypothetical protein